MTVARCPKCGKGVFQVESIMPHGYDRTIICVICHSCNSLLGTMDDFVHESDDKEVDLQFQVLNKKLETVNNNIGQLMNGLKLLYNKLDGIKNSEE